MKTIKHIAIIFLLLIQAISFGQSLETIKDKFNPLLQDHLEGVAVLIKKEGKINTLNLGHLDATKVFNVGSATKTFTAILIMQEVEKGTIKLTDAISKYLNKIKNVDENLTIKTLLTHQSGLNEVIGKNIEEIFYAKSDSIYNNINLLNNIAENNPEEIGEFHYCNTNYLLLGKILKNITDKNYFDLVRSRIIEPLDLKNTFPYVSKSIKNLATPFHNDKDVTAYLDYRYFATVANAAGSIASTLNDMEKFYTSLFETETLLKKETVQKMINSGSKYYGLGLMKSEIKGAKFYGHGGNNIGYAFRNGYNPKTKELFLMFSNNRTIPFKKMIQDDVLAFLNDEKVQINKAINLDIFKKYAGTYLLKEANMKFTILLENEKLFLEVKAQGVKSELFQKNKTTLLDSTVGATLTIIADNADALTFSQNGFTTTINRIK